MKKRFFFALSAASLGLTACSWAAGNESATVTDMSLWQALILGIVEGLTEYLPVSSTGHLLVTQRLMGIGESGEARIAADAYAICIQSGAILAVLGIYFHRIRAMILGVCGRNPDGLRDGRNVVVAFIPAAIVGLLFEPVIKAQLFGLKPIIAAWFLGGAAILIVGWSRRGHPPWTGKDLHELTLRGALLIGVMQCLAMWPGVSRSLVTILGGVMAGLGLPAAVVFSFLLGGLTLTASTAYDLLTHGDLLLSHYSLAGLLAGFAAAWLSASLAVKWMLAYLQKHGFALFGWYRIAIAIAALVLMMSGWLTE